MAALQFVSVGINPFPIKDFPQFAAVQGPTTFLTYPSVSSC
jgi:hypothetical protein